MTAPDPETATGTVEVTIGERTFRARLTVPAKPTPLRTVLPVIRKVADSMVDLAVRDVEAEGKTVSCKAGCGACCRQLVPIAEIEARAIRDLVESLPEPRRTVIQNRFAEARRRLEETGLLKRLERPRDWKNEEILSLSMEYFRLGIPCPFLEDESCSIHPDRPITCREFLVTSPAENCSAPTPKNIDWVPVPVKVWLELARLGAAPSRAGTIRWVPLILAPEWAATHPERTTLRTGPEWLRELLQRLSARAEENQKVGDAL